jgi:hypothetical protein
VGSAVLGAASAPSDRSDDGGEAAVRVIPFLIHSGKRTGGGVVHWLGVGMTLRCRYSVGAAERVRHGEVR